MVFNAVRGRCNWKEEQKTQGLKEPSDINNTFLAALDYQVTLPSSNGKCCAAVLNDETPVLRYR